MRYAKLVALFFMSIGLAMGCKDAMIDTTVDDPPEVDDPVPRKLTPEETFSKLKLLFPNRIIDENFQKLRELTTTKTYLDFLSQAYSTEKPFQTFDAFIETVEPDHQRYLPFLGNFLEKPNEADIVILHQITRGYRNANALQHQFIHAGDFNGIILVQKKKIAVVENKEIQAWLELRFRDREIEQMMTFFARLEDFVIEVEKEDALRIQGLFDEHGEADGVIWLAVLEPTLTGHILNDFADKNTVIFFKWVSGEFFPDTPLNLEQKLKDQLQGIQN